ncbi:hypothetical protein R3P38DRAFT_1351387 [Favolaschia claudopus]|uniref:Uncharacterized protein n=1 Tax=Favolaschia claudopus TaxID=2862362 RepID=A0AAW0DVQ1_9AGAR
MFNTWNLRKVDEGSIWVLLSSTLYLLLFSLFLAADDLLSRPTVVVYYFYLATFLSTLFCTFVDSSRTTGTPLTRGSGFPLSVPFCIVVRNLI